MPRQVISVAKYGSDDRPHTERERERGGSGKSQIKHTTNTCQHAKKLYAQSIDPSAPISEWVKYQVVS